MVLPCTLVSIWIYYKVNTRKYILLNFNCNDEMIQKWIYKINKIKIDLNEYKYICQLIKINNICKFNNLNKIYFERPYVITHNDSNGNRSKYYQDGYIKFIKYNGKSISVNVSYHSQWVQMHSSIQNIMNGISKQWFQRIQWNGFIQ